MGHGAGDGRRLKVLAGVDRRTAIVLTPTLPFRNGLIWLVLFGWAPFTVAFTLTVFSGWKNTESSEMIGLLQPCGWPTLGDTNGLFQF